MTENKRFKHSEFQQDDGQYQYYGIEDTEKNFVYNVIGDGMYDVSEELLINCLNELSEENEQLKQSVNNLKETIIKITIAYQRKYDRNIVDLVHEVHDEDISDLIKELQE